MDGVRGEGGCLVFLENLDFATGRAVLGRVTQEALAFPEGGEDGTRRGNEESGEVEGVVEVESRLVLAENGLGCGGGYA